MHINRNFLSFFTIILLLFSLFSCKTEKKELKPIRYIGDYNRDFNDINELHLDAAKKIGILPIQDREQAEHMKKNLVEISPTKNYDIDELTHSIPFLVLPGADLLNKIGENFRDSLYNLNAPHYKLIVTSVTRTIDDVKRLGNSNLNASLNSAHMYGTTLDISWKRFIKDDKKNDLELTEDQLKMILASVLRDLKKEGLCYIKHERKQACFHITAR